MIRISFVELLVAKVLHKLNNNLDVATLVQLENIIVVFVVFKKNPIQCNNNYHHNHNDRVYFVLTRPTLKSFVAYIMFKLRFRDFVLCLRVLLATLNVNTEYWELNVINNFRMNRTI